MKNTYFVIHVQIFWDQRAFLTPGLGGAAAAAALVDPAAAEPARRPRPRSGARSEVNNFEK